MISAEHPSSPADDSLAVHPAALAERVRAVLAEMDDSLVSQVAALTGLTCAELAELGGVED